jgi:hypothetical protein
VIRGPGRAWARGPGWDAAAAGLSAAYAEDPFHDDWQWDGW